MFENFLKISKKFAIITDETVASLYGNTLLSPLQKEGCVVRLFTFPPGEKYKNRETKEKLEDSLFKEGFGRECALIGLGGGVVTDMAGFLASTFCRGVPLILIPTTLLAMVDASIGGKNGVNTHLGKNLIGTFYPPKKIVLNFSFLKTLPHVEMKNGIAEMIKHALLASFPHFEYLENAQGNICRRGIFESIKIKKKFVKGDLKEKNKRVLLNFGHTVAHAVETASNYEISHGAAVLFGLKIESTLSMQLGYLPENVFLRIDALLKKFESVIDFDPHAILEAMLRDKKNKDQRPHFVLISDIGSPCIFEKSYCIPIEPKAVLDALRSD